MRSKKRILKYVIVCCLLLFSSEILIAQNYVVKSGTVFFNAKTSVNSYTGKSILLQGNIDFGSGSFAFKVPVKSIKTGISKRDEDMYDLLKEDDYPNVLFKGEFINNFDPDVKTVQVLQAKGDFTLAGTTHEVLIDIELNREGEDIRLSSKWLLLITDYNLKQPTKIFLKVNDKHELDVNALLKKE